MPIRSQFNQKWEQGSYEADRNALIKLRENAQLDEDGFQKGVHKPADAKGGGNITIGYGWDIDEQTLGATTQRLKDAGIELTDNQKTVLEAYKKGEEATFKVDGKEVTRVPTQKDFEAAWLDFTITDAQATHMLNAELEKREKGLDDAFKGHEIPQSQERIALMSLFYNTTSGTGEAIRKFAPTMTELIESDPQTPEAIVEQRFDLWYEIVYGSNRDRDNGNQKGLQNRRDEEGARFGLYSKADGPNERSPDPANDHFEARTVQNLFNEKNKDNALVKYRTERDITPADARNSVNDTIVEPPALPTSNPNQSGLEFDPNHLASSDMPEPGPLPPLQFELDEQGQQAIAFVDDIDRQMQPGLRQDLPEPEPYQHGV